MQPPTNRQNQTLDFIRSYLDQYGVAPSRPEIAKALGLRHVSTVDAHLTGLMKKGWVELKQGSPRYIRLLREDLPVVPLGRIAAGEPILVVTRLGDEVTLKRFVRVNQRTVRLEPESTNPAHTAMKVNLATDDFAVGGVYVGALIGQVLPGAKTEPTERKDRPKGQSS